ncbi:hypothetical protein [Pseudomonas mucidolens]|uniref:hypothetical protein n=1 Tax=Pseudomonas mucidolens TaxID=46679 RepID=UPI0030DA0634
MIRGLLLSICLLLSACASQPPLPAHSPSLDLPLQLHVEREQDGQRQDWILVIQHEAEAIRWSLMDPLGIPQARQRLVDGSWQADGLLPPNPQARELFAALLFALTPTDELSGNYPDARAMDDVRVLKPHWQIIYQAPRVFTVYLRGQQLNYHVTPLENAP